MAKRVDHDSTMEVSSSQLVPDAKKRPQPHRAPGVDKNDVSMWIGGVVGAEEFAGKKPKPKRIVWGRVIAAVLLLVGLIGAAAYFLFFRSNAPSTSASAPLDAAAVMATAPSDAGIDAPSDASVDAAVATGPLQADAISGVDGNNPPAKKPVKKTVKKVVKKPAPKKTTTAPKKK
jgi:cytoskeletal protein RodZ